MLRLTAIVLAGLLAGCPKGKGGGGPKAQPGVGCPPASGVYVASWVAPEEAGKGYTGWVLPLHHRVVDTLDGVAPYASIDAGAAQAAGVPAPPQDLWLMLPQKTGGSAPCKVTFGNYYAAAIDAPRKNIAYGIELSGCNPPQDANLETAIALASSEPPGQCQPIVPKTVAAREGTVDKQGRWQRPQPGKETPIPPEFAQLVPQKSCTSPACETLWHVGKVELGGKTIAWAGAVNWLAADNPDPCQWKGDAFSGFFVVGPDGVPKKVTEGQDHPLSLFAVLVDGGGAKALLATGPGEYTAYDYAGGNVTVGRHLVWLVPHPDSHADVERLGPDCGP